MPAAKHHHDNRLEPSRRMSQMHDPQATHGSPEAPAGEAWNNADIHPLVRPQEVFPLPRLAPGAAEIGRKPLRVLIADDQLLVRAGMCELVKLLPGVEVVAQAGDGNEALRFIATHAPDIMLMDIEMPGMNGLEATVLAKKQFPHVKIILLSERSSEEFVSRAFRSGAEAFVLKNASVDELHTVINLVAEGGEQLTPQLTWQIAFDHVARQNGSEESIKITVRQREVLQLIGEGRSTKEIAKLLHVSINTVKTHRLKLMEKLGAHEITSVVRYAVKLGLVKN